MAQTVLYYPTINIPDSQWLRQALLYYDNVASIVPEKLSDVFPVSNELRVLKSKDIFREVKPDDFIKHYKTTQEFEQDFRAIIESQEFQWYLGREDAIVDAQIHEDKVTLSILGYLQDKGLARLDPSRMDWYLFERKTALVYMSVLAEYLAGIEDSTIPATDKRIYHDLLFAKKQQSNGFKCSQLIFNHILPVPRIDVPIEKIIEFREKHALELITLRRTIDEFQKGVISVESERELLDAGIHYGEELRKKVLILDEELQNNKISSFWHSLKVCAQDLKTVVSESLPESLTLATYGGSIGGPPGAMLAGGGVMGLGIAEKGISYKAARIDARYQQRIQVREHPFGYVYSAGKEGII